MIDVKEIISKFRKAPERIGIDACGGGLKAVRLERGADQSLVLAARGYIDVNLDTATPLEMQRAKVMIHQVCGTLKNAALAIEHPTLRIRQMRIAPMPDRDMLEAIRWNFREHVDIPMEQYAVGFTPVERVEGGEQRLVMAYGVARDAIEQYRVFSKSLGCKVVSIEPVATAVLAAFDANSSWNEGQYTAVLVIDEHQAYFLVMGRGTLLFSRPLTGVSLETLTKLLMRNMAIEEGPARQEVENWISRGEGGEPAEDIDLDRRQRLTMTIGHFFSQLVIEVQRTIDAFCIMYEAEKVDVIYVCGQGARFPGIVSHMEKTLGVHTKLFNPFDRVRMREEATPADAIYTTAVGLAIP